GETVDRLASGEARPQADVAGHVREPPVQVDRVVPRVAAEEPRAARVGAQEAEQDADRRGLAGAVRSEEPGDLARADGEVEPVERLHVPERLAQVVHLDGGGRARHGVSSWWVVCWT